MNVALARGSWLTEFAKRHVRNHEVSVFWDILSDLIMRRCLLMAAIAAALDKSFRSQGLC